MKVQAAVAWLIFCAASSVSHAQDTAWIDNGFAFHLPAGFARIHARKGVEELQLQNEQGVGVTVDVLRPARRAPPGPLIKLWSSYAEHDLMKTALRDGKVAIPLHRKVLPSGDILYTLATASPGANDSFGLYFLRIAPDGSIAQVVFEGPGTLKHAMASYRPCVLDATWRLVTPTS